MSTLRLASCATLTSGLDLLNVNCVGEQANMDIDSMIAVLCLELALACILVQISEVTWLVTCSPIA